MDKRVLTCVIADDERSGRDVLRKHIEKVPFLRLVAECKNAFEALSRIQELDPDMIFLDVQMPEMNGIELLALLSKTRPLVVIVSGDAGFAIEGFNNEVVDYVLKPVTFERFAKAVLKVKRHWDPAIPVNSEIQDLRETSEKEINGGQIEDYILVKEGKRLIRIDILNIHYVEAMKDYLKIHWQGGTTLLHHTMSSIEAKLPSPPFIRVHRSFIISKAIIKEFEGNEIKTSTGKTIPIGSTYRDSLLSSLNRNIL